MLPIYYVFLPPVYLLLAAASLAQFQVIYNFLFNLPTYLRRFPLGEPLLPFARAARDVLAKSFGQPSKFSPNLTHVLLVALMLSIIIHLERSRR